MLTLQFLSMGVDTRSRLLQGSTYLLQVLSSQEMTHEQLSINKNLDFFFFYISFWAWPTGTSISSFSIASYFSLSAQVTQL